MIVISMKLKWNLLIIIEFQFESCKDAKRKLN